MLNGVSSFIITLFSSVTTLPVPYGGGGGYDYNDLLVVLGIKPGAYNLGGYGSGAYGLLI